MNGNQDIELIRAALINAQGALGLFYHRGTGSNGLDKRTAYKALCVVEQAISLTDGKDGVAAARIDALKEAASLMCPSCKAGLPQSVEFVAYHLGNGTDELYPCGAFAVVKVLNPDLVAAQAEIQSKR